MRRNEYDKSSQPVRNLVVYPNMEATNGTTAVRTNLITNPSFEYTTGPTNSVVRTNLCVDPQGVSGSLSSYGTNTTFTSNVTLTEHPEGLTKALRVSYDSTSTNAGINIYGNTVAGQTYTMSAWVFHETIAPTPGSQAFAQAGVISQPSPPAIVQGVWQKITWTHTPSNTNPYGFRVSAASGGAGSYLITGILFELTSENRPYVDGATRPALRTNLIPNPTAVNGNGWFAASGSTYTFSTNNAGGPLGTPFVRQAINTPGTGTNYFAVAHGSTTPAYWAPASPGRTYTLSAYIRATMVNYQQPGLRMRWKTAAGTTISDEPIVFASGTTSGQWVRLSSTGVAPAGTRYVELMGGFVSIDQTTLRTGDTVDVSAGLLEDGNTLGSYFDGNTSTAGFTSYGWRGTANASLSYAYDNEVSAGWVGTANNSFSRVYGPSIEGWAASTNSGIYRTAKEANNGTYSGAVVTNGFNGDGIYFNDINVTPGTAFTASAWIKLSSVPPTMSCVLRFKDANQVILNDLGGTIHTTLVVGQWVRVSVTATAPANSAKLQTMWRIYASHTPTTFYIDGAMVEASAFLTPYLDGGTVSSGDFTYAWTGTAHRSTAEERAPRVLGMSGNYSSRVAWQSSQWSASGGKSLAVLGGYPSQDSFSQFDNSALFGSGNLANRTFTFMATVRTTESYPVGADGRAWAFHITYNKVGGGTGLINVKPPLTTAGVQQVRQVVTFPSDASTVSFMRFYNGSPNNTVIYWDNAMIVEGDYSGDFINPAQNTFARWDGTANQSTSVGYSAEFVDMAGDPTRESLSGNLASTSPAASIGPRTVYFVYETTGMTTSYQGPNRYGTTAEGGIGLQTQTAGQNAMGIRFDFPGGESNRVVTYVGARSIGRHVVSAAVNPTMTQADVSFDGASDQTIITSAGTGWTSDYVGMGTQSETIGIRSIVFNAYHDRATRVAIMRYLGNKYGANVA